MFKKRKVAEYIGYKSFSAPLYLRYFGCHVIAENKARYFMSNHTKTIVELFDLRYFNAGSTFKTTIGFMLSLFDMRGKGEELEAIYNYLPISEKLATSGQPTPTQFDSIKEAGFKKIVNLAPHNAENAIEDEEGITAELGLEYVHLPVDFKNPTEADFQRFCYELSNASEKVFVHCAANMRVSAFIYRYRVEEMGIDEDIARKDLEKIWKPFGVWAEFISC